MADSYITSSGEHWRIRETDELIDDGSTCYGITHRVARDIIITKAQTREELVDTALHEAIHAAEGQYHVLHEDFISRITDFQVQILKSRGLLNLEEPEDG